MNGETSWNLTGSGARALYDKDAMWILANFVSGRATTATELVDSAGESANVVGEALELLTEAGLVVPRSVGHVRTGAGDRLVRRLTCVPEPEMREQAAYTEYFKEIGWSEPESALLDWNSTCLGWLCVQDVRDQTVSVSDAGCQRVFGRAA